MLAHLLINLKCSAASATSKCALLIKAHITMMAMQVCFAAIQQLLRLQAHSANPSQAAETLATLLPTLRELAPPAKAMQGLWLGLLAALVKPDAASRAAFAEVRDLMHAWELSEADNGSQQSSSAEWRGQLTALEASCASQAGHAKQVRSSRISHILSPILPSFTWFISGCRYSGQG